MGIAERMKQITTNISNAGSRYGGYVRKTLDRDVDEMRAAIAALEARVAELEGRGTD